MNKLARRTHPSTTMWKGCFMVYTSCNIISKWGKSLMRHGILSSIHRSCYMQHDETAFLSRGGGGRSRSESCLLQLYRRRLGAINSLSAKSSTERSGLGILCTHFLTASSSLHNMGYPLQPSLVTKTRAFLFLFF